MKRNLLVVALLSLGLQGVAHASFPADAERSQVLAAQDTYADRYAGAEDSDAWGVGLQEMAQASPFPSSAKESYGLTPSETYADRHARDGEASAPWGASRRQVESHNPFPFGGGYIDD